MQKKSPSKHRAKGKKEEGPFLCICPECISLEQHQFSTTTRDVMGNPHDVFFTQMPELSTATKLNIISLIIGIVSRSENEEGSYTLHHNAICKHEQSIMFTISVTTLLGNLIGDNKTES